ncbi:MAG: hypothetical protein ABJA87_14220, partial [bacterium]
MTGTDTGSRLDAVRQVADAVLYEGYLLYPYRATSSKNRMRWQFGVLGPPDVQRTGGGEEPAMHVQCLLRADDATTVGVSLRFLQLQIRDVQRGGADGMASVERLTVDGRDVYRWDEAVEREIPFGPYRVSDLTGAAVVEPVDVPGGEDVEPVGADARIVRRRRALAAQVAVRAVAVESGVVRVEIAVANTAPDSVQDRDAATQLSFLGAHLLLSVTGGEWISSLDPPPQLASAVATCTNSRCWPVLAGPEGSTDVVLGSPIILYDHPAVAEQSAGALFDSTEIDEILTLRVMTMTPQEKAEARATDPHAATIIDRCDAMSANSLQLLHGVLRDPHAASELPAPGGWKSAADDGATWSDGQDDVRTG